jgi:hypothetical protein
MQADAASRRGLTQALARMRKLAPTRIADTGVAQCMLYECDDGIYLFPFATLEDGSAMGDQLFQLLEEAECYCEQEFGILATDWQQIGDPLPDCQHDWIAPVRVKGRPEGKPQWGVFEWLVNGEWQEFQPERG